MATASYVGGVKWAPSEGKTSIAVNTFITGQGWNAREAFQHFNSYNLLVTQKLGEKATYVLDATVGNAISTDPNGAAGGGAALWYGFANYLIYAHGEKVTSNLRFELFKDEDGARTGTRGLYTAVTYGINWVPADALIIRPYARYDYNKNGPFEGKNNLYTGGVELIVRY